MRYSADFHNLNQVNVSRQNGLSGLFFSPKLAENKKMAEPGNIRRRSYADLMGQYNRILARFSEMDENGEYSPTERRREGIVDRLMNRYADNIVNSPQYTRAYASAISAGGNREEAYRAADAVRLPYRIYARNRR